MAAAHATNLACAAALWLSLSLSLSLSLPLFKMPLWRETALATRAKQSGIARTSERAISRRSTREFHRRDSSPMKEVGGSGETKASNARKLKSVDAGDIQRGRVSRSSREPRNKRIHWHRSRCFPPDFLYFFYFFFFFFFFILHFGQGLEKRVPASVLASLYPALRRLIIKVELPISDRRTTINKEGNWRYPWSWENLRMIFSTTNLISNPSSSNIELHSS